MSKFKKAIVYRNQQCEAHRGFTESMPPQLVNEWEELCVAFETVSVPKNMVVNPYTVEHESKLRLTLSTSG
jgi:hypothetical protein